MLDLLIRNGTVIDGTGAARRRADVGIRAGRIAALGTVGEAAHTTIDAEGYVVCPGFIDVHTHYDAQVFWDPTLSPSCFHGVTTVFGGHCGFSIAPLSDAAGPYLRRMLARVEGMPLESLEAGVPWNWRSVSDYLGRIDRRVGINVGFMAGHSALRRVVMGERAVGERASESDRLQMQQMLAEALGQGAIGFSSSLSVSHNDADGNPVPSRFAEPEELRELASVCRGFEGTGLECLPGIGRFSREHRDLLAEMSALARRPLNWNVLSIDVNDPAITDEQLALSDAARAQGGDIIALSMPATPNVWINLLSGMLFDALPGWAPLFRMSPERRCEFLRESSNRAALDAQARAASVAVLRRVAAWGDLVVADTVAEGNARHRGRSVAAIAADLQCSPFDAMLDVAIADGLRTSFLLAAGAEPEELWRRRQRAWLDDRVVVGASDAGAHLDMIDSFAFSTRLLAAAVRERGLLSLEQAIHLLTDRPARLYGLRQRGRLQPGWHADLVVFAPDTIGCGDVHMRYDMPAGAGRLFADARGIEQVIVNGVTIVRAGRHTGALPGTVLRSGRDTRTPDVPLH